MAENKKRNDPEQSKRFEKTARKVEVEDNEIGLEKAIGAILEQAKKPWATRKGEKDS